MTCENILQKHEFHHSQKDSDDWQKFFLAGLENIAQELIKNKEQHDATAREWTRRYAKA